MQSFYMGTFFRSLRLKQKLSIEQVSELAKVDQDTIENFEDGKEITARPIIVKLLNSLNSSYLEFENYFTKLKSTHKQSITIKPVDIVNLRYLN